VNPAAPAGGTETAPAASDPDLSLLFHSTPWPMLVCDPDGRIVSANPIAADQLGAGQFALAAEGTDDPSRSLHRVLRPVGVDLAVALVDVATTGTPVELPAVTHVGWSAQVHLHALHIGRFVVATVRPSVDGTHRAALRDHEDRFRALCEHAPAGILCAESGMRVDYVNDRCAELFGVEPEDLWGFGWLGGLADASDVEAASDAIEVALSGVDGGPLELTVRRPDGSVRLIEARFAPNGRGGGFVGTVEDVTEERTLAGQLEYQASHDELTGLGNRRLMVEYVDAAVTSIRAGRSAPAGLVFIDLDNFKFVNDTLGHGVGDQLLAEVSARLVSSVRPHDLVTRFGGDEFVVLLPDNGEAAVVAADRLVQAVSVPYVLDGHLVTVTASAGVVVVDGTSTAEHTLRDADVAMYQAKRGGKNRAAIFSPEAQLAAERQLTVLNALRVTLESHIDRLAVVYQPICALDGTVIGVEALARWTDPDLGEVPPSVFIEVAEASGYANRIGEYIRGTAIDAAAGWRAAGWQGYLSVNVSAGELASDELVGQLTAQLELSGLEPSALCAEVTETAVMADRDAARRVLDDLAALGVALAIDDFGTGYSSLAYLKRFPVSVLKLDREFVGDVGIDGRDRAICAAIVALADALGMRVVAEGIETAEQHEGIAELGVDAAQGWWFARPVTAAEIPALLGLDS
jgi:diguanylate cyclase (GGDEF)-like protein/PAS domain S-box-containing protein